MIGSAGIRKVANIENKIRVIIIKKTDNGTTYQCSCCGQEYNEPPLTFGTVVPDFYHSVPVAERESRIEIKESLCVVDDQHFFHRGRLTIPINDSDLDLIFNVWTSISEDNFIKRNQLWNNPDRVKEKPYFGWLQTIVPGYGDTLNIKTIAIENDAGLIPTIKVIEEGHLLKDDQENGISLSKALQIAGDILMEQHSTTGGGTLQQRGNI